MVGKESNQRTSDRPASSQQDRRPDQWPAGETARSMGGCSNKNISSPQCSQITVDRPQHVVPSSALPINLNASTHPTRFPATVTASPCLLVQPAHALFCKSGSHLCQSCVPCPVFFSRLCGWLLFKESPIVLIHQPIRSGTNVDALSRAYFYHLFLCPTASSSALAAS